MAPGDEESLQKRGRSIFSKGVLRDLRETQLKNFSQEDALQTDKANTSQANLGEGYSCEVRHKAEGLEALSVWCKSNPPGQTAPRVHADLQTCD